MNPVEILIATLVLLQAFLCLLWFGGAWLRMARRSSLQWGVANLLLGVGMVLLAQRHLLDPWFGRWGANAANLLCFVIAARGSALFTRSPPRDGEHALVLLLGLGGAALALATPIGHAWVTACASGAMAWTALRSAVTVSRALHPEFGGTGAWLSATPMALIGLLTGLRAVGAALGTAAGQPLDQNSAPQIGFLFGFIGLSLAVNAGFGGMVVMRLIIKLRHLSLHDTLTRLPNRRSLLAALADEHERYRRGGGGYALLSIDVDHFKRINDHHGHAGGDAALVHLADILRSVARVSDRVARVGGEEFAMLLPATDRAGAVRAAERLLDAVRRQPLVLADARLPLTVSIGVSTALQAGEELAMLWKRVDAALYEAKAQGRDRLVLAAA